MTVQVEVTQDVVYNTFGGVRWDANCAVCVEIGLGGFGPSHEASNRCIARGANHCSCAVCF